MEAERDRFKRDSDLLSMLHNAVMAAAYDTRICDLLPGKWPDLRSGIERNLDLP